MARNIDFRKYPLLAFKTRRDFHIYKVYTDEAFIKLATKLEELESHLPVSLEDSMLVRRIIRSDFEITDTDINLFYICRLLRITNEESKCRLYFDHDKGKFCIELDPGATLAELRDQYNRFKDFENLPYRIAGVKKKESTRKLPLYMDLVYSVFRAIKQGYKKKEIFALYTTGELNGYSKKPLFKTEKELFDYYRKHSIDNS